MPALIFTDELARERVSRPKASELLIHQWAAWDGPEGPPLRAQLERAASQVPAPKLSRILGHLRSSDSDQVMGAVATLLLAKTLQDLGWRVEHEPEIDGLTPDFRVSKGRRAFVVEMKQIRGSARPKDELSLDLVRKALRKLRTRTPIYVHSAAVDGRASLRGFRAHLERVFRDPPKGEQVFQDEGVEVVYEVLPEVSSEVSAFGAVSYGSGWVNDREDVASAIDEKLARYRCPLIVALDMMTDCLTPFETVEDVLLGQQQITIPIPGAPGEPSREVTFGRSKDGIFARPNHAGSRARDRLIAALPLQLRFGATGFEVHARVMANPAGEGSAGLEDFLPMPCLLVVSRTMEQVILEYTPRDADAAKAPTWFHVP